MMHFEETADIETASEDYASRFAGPVGEYFLAVQARLTLELLADYPGASVLDVGGGHAQLAPVLLENGYRVTVTGSNEVCRRRLDRFCPPGSFSYRTCDSLHLPFAENEFDVVLSFRLLPHAENWQGLIREMCRVADRVIIVDYPDQRSVNILYDYLFALKKNLEGNTRSYRLFSRRQIRDTLGGCGFSSPVFRPEFFLPMVLHRRMGSAPVSTALEAACRAVGLTALFGSPIIVRSERSRVGGKR